MQLAIALNATLSYDQFFLKISGDIYKFTFAVLYFIRRMLPQTYEKVCFFRWLVVKRIRLYRSAANKCKVLKGGEYRDCY